LDLGCGTGYGTAELAYSASEATGIDLAPVAISACRAAYPSIPFLVGSCTAVPFPANHFDLVVAFEVIEHLADYRALLDEVARVLTHQGLFIVSSPNRLYYAEQRAQAGPNPYHEHEFEPEEFVKELSRVFSNVRLLLQNRVESFAFHPAASTFWPADARIEGGGGSASDSHFLVALCSFGPLPEARSFVFVPRAANLLWEREQHVKLLEQQLAQTKRWLDETQSERDQLIALHSLQKDELEARNRWAQQLTADLEAAGRRVVELQDEFAAEQQAAIVMAAAYEEKVSVLDAESRARAQWALDTEARLSEQLRAKSEELAKCVGLLDQAEATVAERTVWAQREEGERRRLAEILDLIRVSRWIKLGRAFHVGPDIHSAAGDGS
jgi:SAM-dependent methyltransferase